MSFGGVTKLPKYHRRSFFALVGMVTFALIVIDMGLAGTVPIKEAVAAVIAHLLAGIVTALLVAVFLGFFLPPDQSGDSLQQLPATEITPAFNAVLSQATNWSFKGNFGRYLRGKVLPTLAGRSNLHVHVNLIDPSDKDLCRRHAQYRGEIEGVDKGKSYSDADVARQVVATILHCAWYVANKAISIDLYTSKTFDPIRIDATSDVMLITVEDRRRPALRLTSANFMFEHFNIQMRYSREQGSRVDLHGFPRKAIDQVTETDIDAFCGAIGMGALCHELGSKLILREFRQNDNPYTT